MIGFAAETEHVIEHAKAKLERKGCDWIVANDVSADTGVMGGDRNTVHLVTARRRRILAAAVEGRRGAARWSPASPTALAGARGESDRAPRSCGCRTRADLPLPAYQSALAAGLDLIAAVPADAPVVIAPGERAAIPTGIAIALPPGTEGQVRPRSGLALRHGVTVLNSPGHASMPIIAAKYRSCWSISAQEPFTVARGTRIAQLVHRGYTASNDLRSRKP